MVSNKIFLATSNRAVRRAVCVDGQWRVTRLLEDVQVNCFETDRHKPGRVYAGTQESGLYVSENAGSTWRQAGSPGIAVKSMAASPHEPDVLYAAGKPLSLHVSRDAGETWEELPSLRDTKQWWWWSPAEPPDFQPYVLGLTISPTDPDVILAGIELGGVLRSEDGGKTWSKHLKKAQRDCHSLKFHHSDGNWVYQGGGGGPAFSKDGGRTWRQPKDNLGMVYGWMAAADPARPEVWYLSASSMPNPLRGEFVPPAHNDGHAKATIYRSVGGAPWEPLAGGLPKPIDYMPYALEIDPDAPGHLYAGMANGDVWHTVDYGDTWKQLPFNLGGIHREMVVLDA